MIGIKKTSLFVLFFLVFSFRAFAAIPSPVGKWVTIDDETQKPRSVINIWEDTNGKLAGTIAKVFYREGEDSQDVCSQCTDPEHQNKRILGMVLLWGMSENPSDPLQWSGGQILDPHNGKIYSCKITISPDGNTLTVRGYLGISLLGRSQTWHRGRAPS
jgi:uncharacterized protein (DUF2147 family)